MSKFKYNLLYVLLLTMCSHYCSAQTNDSLLRQLAVKWQNSKAYTLKMAESMPEEAYDFKPVPDQMSYGEQLLHIADNMLWLSADFLLGAKSKNKNNARPSKNEIINIVSAAYDSGLAAHYRLTTLQLDEMVKFFAGPKTRRQILVLMHDHQTHHVGQLIVYLRLKGIKPPAYVGW